MKNGIEYFPFNTNFFDDDKIALVEVDHGLIGSYVAIRIMSKIYDSEGYYCHWGEDERKLFVKRISGAEFDLEKLDGIVESCLERDFFDRGMYEKYHILTSRGIQKRFLEAVSRRQVTVIREYMLLPELLAKYANVKYALLDIPPAAVEAEPQPQPVSESGQVPAPAQAPVAAAPAQSPEPAPATPPRRKRSGTFNRTDCTELQMDDLNILHLFFFNNWKAPNKEVEKFKRWNERQFAGKFANWEKIPKHLRHGAAIDWKQDPQKNHFSSTAFLQCWEELYKNLQQYDTPYSILHAALCDGIAYRDEEKYEVELKGMRQYYVITCPDIVSNYIKSNPKLLPDAIKRLYDAGSLRFETCSLT